MRTSLLCCIAGEVSSAHRLHRRNQFGNIDSDQSSLAGTALNLQPEIGAIQNAKTLAHVAETDALNVDVRHLLFGNPGAVVLDLDVKASVGISRAELNASALEFRG